MARQQQVSYTLTCDVCDEEIPDEANGGASRDISWDGTEYQVDLCPAHQGQLDDCSVQLKVFIDAGQPMVGRRGRGAARTSSKTSRSRRAVASPSPPRARGRGDVPAIRVWARENGYQVGDRARIAASIMAAYDEAQGSAPAPTRLRKRAGKPAAGG